MIYIGLRFARGAKMSSEGFFLGNRKMPTWAVGLSLYATGTSAISMMAIPAKAYATNWLYFAGPIFSVFVFARIAIFMAPRKTGIAIYLSNTNLLTKWKIFSSKTLIEGPSN